MIKPVKIDPTLARKLTQFQKQQTKTAYTQLTSQPVEDDPTLEQAIILDLDGTLALRGQREAYDWQHCGVDRPCPQIMAILRSLSPDIRRIIITNRPETYRPETELWLSAHHISYEDLYMRAEGDHREGSVIKADVFNQFIRRHYNVFFAMDDQPGTAKMWRSLGLYVFNVG